MRRRADLGIVEHGLENMLTEGQSTFDGAFESRSVGVALWAELLRTVSATQKIVGFPGSTSPRIGIDHSYLQRFETHC